MTVLDEQSQADYVVERVLQAAKQGVAGQAGGAFPQLHHSDVLELELVRRNIPS